MTVLQERLLLDDDVCKSRPRQDNRQSGYLISSRLKLFVLTSRLSGAEVERRSAVHGRQTCRDKSDCNHRPAARRFQKNLSRGRQRTTWKKWEVTMKLLVPRGAWVGRMVV